MADSTRALVTGTYDPTVVLPFPNLDAVLTGANGGIRGLFDLAFGPCYPGGALATRPAPGAPYAGQPVYDMGRRRDLQARAPAAGPAPAYAGGGFDFTDITHNDGGVRGPNDSWAGISGGAGRVLICGYYRLPAQADWWAAGSFLRIFSGSDVPYSTGAEGFAIVQFSGKLAAVRQVAAGSVTGNQIEVAPTADHYGKPCQVAYWRTATAQGLRIAPLVGVAGKIDLTKAVSATIAPGAASTVDFSASSPQWGVPVTNIGAPMSAAQAAATNIRLYRGWIEDLAVSGRDPVAVLDADAQRVLDRMAASAAATGGVSRIFA